MVTQRPSTREDKNHPTRGEGGGSLLRDAEGNCTGQPRPLAFLADGREWSLSHQDWPSKGAAKSPATPWRHLHPATGQAAGGWKGRASLSQLGRASRLQGHPQGSLWEASVQMTADRSPLCCNSLASRSLTLTLTQRCSSQEHFPGKNVHSGY